MLPLGKTLPVEFLRLKEADGRVVGRCGELVPMLGNFFVTD